MPFSPHSLQDYLLLLGGLLCLFMLVKLVRRAHALMRLRPPWASFMTYTQWERFLIAVARNLHARQLPLQYQDGVFHVQLGEQQQVQIGLGNLAQVCHQAREAQWGAIIATHFDQMLQDVHDPGVEALLQDFDQVKDRLFVRLIAMDAAISLEHLAVARNDIPDVIAYLALDLPVSVRSIAANEIAPWRKTPGELYAIGLANVREKSQYEAQDVEAPECTLIGVTSDSLFTASHALLLHEHPEWIGKYGALLIIPTRHNLVIHPINDLSLLKALPCLCFMATEMEKEGPGSITNHVYWYDDGRYVEIPYSYVQKQLNLSPPDAFTALMSRIAEEEGAPAGTL